MPYSPLQARGPDGRFIKTGAIGAATKGMTGAKTGKAKTKSGARGSGYKGLKANFTPYVRVNKRSQTVGYNAGTLIPGTHRRIVTGTYVRLESTKNKTVVDRFIDKKVAKVFPTGTRRGKVAGAVGKVKIVAPVVRVSRKNTEFRLGTSRGAGSTLIVRRGKHKTDPVKSAKGVHQYNKRMSQIAGQKAKAKAKKYRPRSQRRRAARRKK